MIRASASFDTIIIAWSVMELSHCAFSWSMESDGEEHVYTVHAYKIQDWYYCNIFTAKFHTRCTF